MQECMVETRNAYEGHKDEIEDAVRRERDKAERLWEEDKLLRLIDAHFGLEKYAREETENNFVIDYCKTVEKLSCKGCCHVKDRTCTGKNLRGRTIIGCPRQAKHEECHIGNYQMEDAKR